MNTLEVREANFRVGKAGLKITTSDKTVIEFYQGDGVRISNKAGVPVLEYIMNGKKMAVVVKESQTLKDLLNRLAHTTEFRQSNLDLMEALSKPSSEISTDQLFDSFSKAVGADGKHVKSLQFEKRIVDLTTEGKAKLLTAQPLFKEGVTEVTLTAIADASDPDLADDELDEEDEDEDEDEVKERRTARRTKLEGLKQKLKEEEDKDEDDKDKDKMESLKKSIREEEEEDDEDEKKEEAIRARKRK